MRHLWSTISFLAVPFRVAKTHDLTLAPVISEKFSAPWGYDGDMTVDGVFTIGQMGSSEKILKYRLTGLDPSCNSSNTASGKECGISLSMMSTCDQPDDPENMWWVAHYETVGSIPVSDEVQIASDQTLEQFAHTVRVHDSDGAIGSCSVLSAVKIVPDSKVQATNFVKYPGYYGYQSVSGYVNVYQTDQIEYSSQVLVFALQGVDALCDLNKPNACGISIHRGTSCETAYDVGDHYTAISADLWDLVQYKAHTSAGMIVATGDMSTGKADHDFMFKGVDNLWITESVTVPIPTGLTSGYILGHALVVTSSTGERIACSIIKESGTAAVSMVGLILILCISLM